MNIKEFDQALVREGRLRHTIPVGDVSPSGEAVLRSAFEGDWCNGGKMVVEDTQAINDFIENTLP